MPRPDSSTPREPFWRQHIHQQRAGGLSIRAYCLKHGLSEPSFYSWRRTIRDRDRQPASATPKPDAVPAFLPVALVDAPANDDRPSIEIRLAHGCHVHVRNGCDRVLLADVLALLQSQPAPEDRPC